MPALGHMSPQARQRQADAQRTRTERTAIRKALNAARRSGGQNSARYKALLSIETARQWAAWDGRLWTPPTAAETRRRHEDGNRQRAIALAQRREDDAAKAKAAKALKAARFADQMETYDAEYSVWKSLMRVYNAVRKPYRDWVRKRRDLSTRSSVLRKLAHKETREYFVARRTARQEFRKAKIWPYVLPTRDEFGNHLKELNKVQAQLFAMGATEERRLYAQFRSAKYPSRPRRPRKPR